VALDPTLVNVVLIPLGLGLLGFIEPCSMGANLLFIQYLEGRDGPAKIAQTTAYAATRTFFTGALGAGAGLIGAAFLSAQKAAWLVLGLAYAIIGILYIAGKGGTLALSLMPRFAQGVGTAAPVGLGVVFGLNIPACAAPLLLAVLGMTAAGGYGSALYGFVALAFFGFALSIPLLVAVLWPSVRGALDWLAGQAKRLPALTGLVFIVLGLWSTYFGLFVSIAPP
jgi:cytochrome c-type biogenesis protein